jgi:DNA-directed RNA polymerase specialized sigma24 family protein
MDIQEEIVRLLALQVRMRFENQADAIRELYRAGFGPARIAELLGTSAGTVNVTVAKARKRRQRGQRREPRT